MSKLEAVLAALAILVWLRVAILFVTCVLDKI